MIFSLCSHDGLSLSQALKCKFVQMLDFRVSFHCSVITVHLNQKQTVSLAIMFSVFRDSLACRWMELAYM